MLIAVAGVYSSCTQNKSTDQEMVMVGAFGEASELTAEEAALFKVAVSSNVSCKDWTPVKVSRQVVAGTNYKFLCKDKEGRMHTVTVFSPLPGRGEPGVTAIDEKN